MVELKKNPSKDLRKQSHLFHNIGLVLSLLICIYAFEYKVYNVVSEVKINSSNEQFDELIDIPQTVQPPPPKPAIQNPEIIEVPDEKEIIEDIEIDLDIEMTENDVIEEVILTIPEPEEEKVEEIFTIVEEQPTPIDGYSGFYKWVGKNLNYPSQARRMGIEGRVFLQFVVEKDGSLTDIKVIKGIGGGCDEEAKRIVSEYPGKWKPGKQRGRAVRVRFSWALKFALAQ
jgi:protein TonB